MATLKCPDCGTTDLTLREAESSWNVRSYHCAKGHKFHRKTPTGYATEVAPLVIAVTAVARLLGVDIDISDHLS